MSQFHANRLSATHTQELLVLEYGHKALVFAVTIFFKVEANYRIEDGVEGELDVPIPIGKDIAYRFPLSGNIHYGMPNIRFALLSSEFQTTTTRLSTTDRIWVL